jgi:hypothetical protein
MLGHLVGRIVFGGCVDHALNDGGLPRELTAVRTASHGCRISSSF